MSDQKDDSQVWMMTDDGTARQISSKFTIEKTLPKGIYNIDLVPFEGWVLNRYTDEFRFDYKLYDLQNPFIEHVIKTFNETSGNLGILLNGTKGTGKTVTAKVLANRLQLPVIIIKSFGEHNQQLIEYLSGIDTDCILFFDEFEKNFSENDSTILQIMDGVYNSSFRKVFLLTTNTMTINDNLIGRPSRIRYVETFKNLSLRTVKAYLEDNLIDKSVIDEVVEYIDSLTISTIDILKSIVSEINIHGIEAFRIAKSFFNVKNVDYHYHVYMSSISLRDYEKGKIPPNGKYTIPKFSEAVKERDKFDDARTHCGIEEYSRIADEYQKYRENSGFGCVDFRNLESQVKFHNMKIGTQTEFGVVIDIDYEKKIIVVRDDEDYNEEIAFVYVINPDVKPSLYSSYTYKAY